MSLYEGINNHVLDAPFEISCNCNFCNTLQSTDVSTKVLISVCFIEIGPTSSVLSSKFLGVPSEDCKLTCM